MQQSTISPKGNNQGASPSSRGYNGTSTRQPIHTPLISNQPVSVLRIYANNIIELTNHFPLPKIVDQAERINGSIRINRRRETNINCWRLSNPNQITIDQIWREIVEENPTQNQKQSKFTTNAVLCISFCNKLVFFVQISAQESRRKKKEYMDKLERQVEVLVSENTSYSKRIETLEETNANLISQLAKMQALINRQTSNLKKS